MPALKNADYLGVGHVRRSTPDTAGGPALCESFPLKPLFTVNFKLFFYSMLVECVLSQQLLLLLLSLSLGMMELNLFSSFLFSCSHLSLFFSYFSLFFPLFSFSHSFLSSSLCLFSSLPHFSF